MRLRYIGKDNQVSPKPGRIYAVRIFTRGTWICVEWRDFERREIVIRPYTSLKHLLENWEELEHVFKDEEDTLPFVSPMTENERNYSGLLEED